jgi:cytochrome P450
VRLEPFTGAYLTGPAHTWRRLLDSPERVHYAEDLNLWLIVHHADVRNALSDAATFTNSLTLAPVYDMCPEAWEIVAKIDAPPTTAAADHPTHPRTRAALRDAFANTAARAREWYGPYVDRRVNDLVDRIAARPGDTIDLAADLAAPLPLQVIADILAVPEQDIPQIKQWSDGQIALVWGNPDPEEQVRLAQGLLDFWRYCQLLVSSVHRDGGWRPGGVTDGADDFISRVLRWRRGDDDRLTLDEAASLAFNLLVAGHETTSGLVNHCLDHVLTAPTRWEVIAHYPEVAAQYVEETLRFGPPIDGWLRATSRPVTIGDTTIPAGARCLLLLGAAGHDPAVYPDPDRFDPDRFGRERDQGVGHLAFGHGPHFCIGAALARLEAQTALTRLAEQLPGLRLADGYQRTFRPNVAFRAHTTLPAVVPTSIPQPATGQ